MVSADGIETASWPRRILALFVDQAVSTLVVIAIIGAHEYAKKGGVGNYLVLPVFVVESALFTWLLAGSFGQLVTGLRVIPGEGPLRPHNPLRILVRQLLVALVIPPLVFRSDGRGLHDVAAGTKTVKAEDMRAAIRQG